MLSISARRMDLAMNELFATLPTVTCQEEISRIVFQILWAEQRMPGIARRELLFFDQRCRELKLRWTEEAAEGDRIGVCSLVGCDMTRVYFSTSNPSSTRPNPCFALYTYACLVRRLCDTREASRQREATVCSVQPSVGNDGKVSTFQCMLLSAASPTVVLFVPTTRRPSPPPCLPLASTSHLHICSAEPVRVYLPASLHIHARHGRISWPVRTTMHDITLPRPHSRFNLGARVGLINQGQRLKAHVRRRTSPLLNPLSSRLVPLYIHSLPLLTVCTKSRLVS